MKYKIYALILILILSVATIANAAYREGEILVKYKSGRSLQSIAPAVAGAKTVRSLDQIRTRRIALPPGVSVDDAIASYRKDPNVEYATPNHIISICREPSDEYYYYYDEFLEMYSYEQWGLYSDQYPTAGIEAPKAWDINTGSPDIIIAIIDTGVYAEHEDLYAKIVPGHNCLSSATDPNDTEDDHGHGTFVAGVAAAMTDNGIGVAGVSWGSMIMPIKVMNANGEGAEDDAAAGIIWAADHGAKILNLSLGGYDYSQAEYDAIEYAWNKGCIIVAASGNDDTDRTFYPASFEHVLSVGATNESRQRCTSNDWGTTETGDPQGSNYGSYLKVMAPGNNITSTSIPDPDWGDILPPYTASAGTSAAAPFVSGTAALVLSQFPTWTNSQVVTQIEDTCYDIGDPGWDQYTGYGLISAYRALSSAPVVPTKIGALTSMSSGSIVRVSGAVITSGSSSLYDRFYVEQDDRTCGICLPFDKPPAGYSEGDIISISGTLMTVAGERSIQGAILTKTAHTNPVAPVGMPNKSVGGGRIALKGGITGGTGLNNISMLVTVWGRVTSVGWTYFYIDDGSMRYDGSGFNGLKIISDRLTPPMVGSLVRITGVSSCEQPPRSNVTIPVVRVRKQSDIITM